MAENLFESDPISYRMDRKSRAAFNLRDALNKKLFDFLGNYSDDGVLAEYIVVLVCNGKHQKQARDDLEAFLGDDSANFVAWLWDHLAKENHISRAPLDSTLKAEVSSSCEEGSNKERKSSSLTDHHTQSTGMPGFPLPKNGRSNASNHAIYSNNSSEVIQTPESLQKWCPIINASLTEESTGRLQAHLNEVKSERLKAEPVVINNDSRAAYHTGATKQFSSTVRCSPESPSGDEQLNNGYLQQKIAKINSSAVLHRPLSVPRTDQAARGLRSVVTDNHQSTPLPMRNSGKIRLQSTAIDSEAHQTARPRGNVWDRLGKPQNEDDAGMRGMTNLHDNHLIKRDMLDFQGEELRSTRSIWIKQDDGLSSNIAAESIGFDNNCHGVVLNSTEYRKLVHNSSNAVGLPHVNNSKRKRLYRESNSGNSSASFPACKEIQLQVKEAPPKMQDPVSIKARSNKVASEAKGSATLFSESTHNSVISTRIKHNSQADKVDLVISSSVERKPRVDKVSPDRLIMNDSVATQTQKVHPDNTPLPSKSESPSKAECANGKRRQVKDEVLDVKSKLRQMETDMLKLRSKQAEMRIDAKPNALAGMQNHSEEDNESRTVLVTNVHFAATREALLSHFSKCGAIAKVVMLTDTITSQSKGAAYIVFVNKDSVDKAVSMNRTSFFSRILTVMRKANMPPDFLVPSQSAGKLMQPFHPQPFWKGSGQRSYSSTHLQWRRENHTNRENTTGESHK